MTDRADVPLDRAEAMLAHWSADALADLVTVALSLAAVRQPDAVRKALLPVIGGKEYRQQLETLRNLCTNTRKQLDEQWKAIQEHVQMMNDLCTSTEKRLDEIEKRLDGVSLWLDGLAEKAREIKRRVG